MSDHLWFIPVTGGWPTQPTGAPPGVYEPREINVQWNVTSYPTSPPVDIPCVRAAPIVMFTPGASLPGVQQARLTQCYGSWRWRSCSDGQVITVGGQLEVGTVFARGLPLDNNAAGPPSQQAFVTWSDVDVWVKYRVSDYNRLSALYLSINDMTGVQVAASPNMQPLLNPAWNSVWRVEWLSRGNWQGWDTPPTNLRVVLTALGTVNIANVGLVTVDVEWFAIRLRGEVNP